MIDSSPRSFVGKKIKVCSMVFYIARYDPHRRLLTMRNVYTKKEHAISPRELYGYLTDPVLTPRHIHLLEDSFNAQN